MCFSIPYKVIQVGKDTVTVEGGKIVRIDRNMNIMKNAYVQVVGDVAVSSLSKEEGLKIRKLIKRLN